MKKLVEKCLEDLSTKEMFLFRVACANCGEEYAKRPVRFSKSGNTPATRNKEIIYAVVYEQEHMAARQSAIADAAEHLNYCPICKRLICNRCFLICDDLDMCQHCAASLPTPPRRPVSAPSAATPSTTATLSDTPFAHQTDSEQE